MPALIAASHIEVALTNTSRALAICTVAFLVSLRESARYYAARRGLSGEVVVGVARAPEQRIAVQPGRELRQSRVAMPAGGTPYLIRAVVDAGPSDEIVVTVYRTSKIERHWSQA